MQCNHSTTHSSVVMNGVLLSMMVSMTSFEFKQLRISLDIDGTRVSLEEYCHFRQGDMNNWLIGSWLLQCRTIISYAGQIVQMSFLICIACERYRALKIHVGVV